MITRRDFGKLSGTLFAVAASSSVRLSAADTTTPILASATGRSSFGTYWGHSEESINLLSGNLSYTLPLLQLKSRKLSISLHAAYNSQSWKSGAAQESSQSGSTLFVRALGAAWQLSLGSIETVTDAGGVVRGYTYTTSTGAVLPLLQTPSGWITVSGSYLSWNPASATLSHSDGTTLHFESQSSAGEPDAGTLHPTLIQDRNGNQIVVNYAVGAGGGAANTSGRISSIADARSAYSQDGQNSYVFEYSGTTTPSLVAIRSLLPINESYTFSYAQQALTSSAGKGTANAPLLVGVSRGSGASRAFSYNNSAELLSASNWNGGVLSWDYQSVTMPSGQVVREVSARTLTDPTSASAGFTVTLSRPGDNPAGDVHSVAQIASGSQPLRLYSFNKGTSAALQGLLVQTDEYGDGGSVIETSQVGWKVTSFGSPYKGSRVRTLSPGSSAQKTSRWELTQDDFHNAVEVRSFGYRSAGTPTRVETKTYLQTPQYTSRGILNLVSSFSVQRKGQTSMQQYAYDSTPVSSAGGVSLHDSAGHGTSLQVRGNQTEIVTSGYTRTYSYDETGMVRSMQDSRGYEASFAPAPNTNGTELGSVSGAGRLVSSTSFTFGSKPVHTSMSINGSSVTSIHDAFGRSVSASSSSGLTSARTYDDAAGVQTVETGGLMLRFTTDGFGRTAKQEKGPAGQQAATVTLFEYAAAGASPLGKVSRYTNPAASGATTQWTQVKRDASGRVITRTLPDGTQHQVQRSGSSVTVTNTAGVARTLTYDAEANLESVQTQDPSGSGTLTTNYTYAGRGKLASVTMKRAAGTQQRAYSYDSSGRIVRRQEPESGQKQFTYYPDGTLAVMRDANGNTHTYTRDSQKRVVAIQRANAAGTVQPQASYTFSFDTNPYDSAFTENGINRVTAVQWGDPSSSPGQFTEMYSYSPSGTINKSRLRMTRGQQSVDLDLAIGFDSQGRVSSLLYPGASQALQYEYDAMGRPLSVSFANGDAVVSNVSYDVLGRLQTMRTLASKTDGYVTENRSYLPSGQLASLAVSRTDADSNAEIPLLSKSYQYAATTRKLVMERDLLSSDAVNYTYDVEGRLTAAATESDAWGLSYTYDAFENRTSQKVTKGQGYEVDAAYSPETNWLLSEDAMYDKNGNMLSLPDLSLQYDTLNRLSAAQHKVNGTEQYAYNPANLRIWQKSASREIVSFYHGGSRLMTFSVVSAADGSFSLTPRDGNVFFRNRVVRRGTSVLSSDDRNAVRVATHGASPVARTFLPFGEEVVKTADDTVKFGGYVRDSVTGLDYAQQRYYSSSLGRFITPDPENSSAKTRLPQSWNRYAFVLNDPINHVDANGLDNTSPAPPQQGPTTPQTTPGTFTDGSNSTTTVTYDPNDPGHGTIVTSTILLGDPDEGSDPSFDYEGPNTTNPSSTDVGNDLMALGGSVGALGTLGAVATQMATGSVESETPEGIAVLFGSAEIETEIGAAAMAAGASTAAIGVGAVIFLVGAGLYFYARSQQTQ